MRRAARRLRSFHSRPITGRRRWPRYQISNRILPLCSVTPPEADFRPNVRTPEYQQVYARQVRVGIGAPLSRPSLDLARDGFHRVPGEFFELRDADIAGHCLRMER